MDEPSSLHPLGIETLVAEEKEEILHTRRQKLNPQLNRGVPRSIEGVLVAAAVNALNGWLPRGADTFNHKPLFSSKYRRDVEVLLKVIMIRNTEEKFLECNALEKTYDELVGQFILSMSHLTNQEPDLEDSSARL
ncbi:hypothetical protein H5410_036093 [Solanum commersonii]|uniref:Uncharacterized protein n=1 Tax=Solanum commersonii TaxID=4109 RepID=A0A9J5Y3R8_SOLCO|nr:hypothetical protein H5410_036093 [Solanum commersonii]